MGIATRIVQVSPVASLVDNVLGTSLIATWQLETTTGTPLPNKQVGIFLDHNPTYPVVVGTTNSSGRISTEVGIHTAYYIGSTWDWDVRFAGDATYDASGSPYLSIHLVEASGNDCTVEGAHQGGTLCWDGVTYVGGEVCSGGSWVPNTDVCPDQPICTEGEVRLPTLCGDGSTIYAEECIGGDWVATLDECPLPPTCTDGELAQPFECDDGSLIYLKVCEANQWIDSGQDCAIPPPPNNNNMLIGLGLTAAVVVAAAFIFMKK